MRAKEFITEAGFNPEIKKVLLSKGYKFLGKGQDQDAYLEPSTGMVLKIFGTDKYSNISKYTRAQQSFVDFANFCMKNPNNKFLPYFDGWERFEFNGKYYLQIRVERMFDSTTHLGKVAPVLWELCQDIDSGYGSFADWYSSNDDDERVHQLVMVIGGKEDCELLWKTMKQLDKIAAAKDYSLDLHQGNFMLGGDGELIISDPFFTGSWRTTVKENNSPTALTEAATDNLYHYTSSHRAAQILTSGKFLLQNGKASDVEQRYQPEGYDFFLSTTRSKVGDYHKYNSPGDVIFNLDGRIINQRYKTTPVDYWERSWNYSGSSRTSESEDRIFSRTPEIPINIISEVHMIVDPNEPTKSSPTNRATLLAAKRAGIPVYVYDERKYWIAQYKQKALPVEKIREYLSGNIERNRWTGGGKSERFGRSYPKLFNYVELMQARDINKLNPVSIKLISNLVYSWSPKELASSLNNDLSNGRTPDSEEYNRVNQVTQFMRTNKLNTETFIQFLINKWKQPYLDYLKQNQG